VIVSGLALGIDGVAHQAALEAGGLTVAVLGTAIDHIYPASHRGLAKEILQNKGAILSELGPKVEEHGGIFPARNRIIAGLSQAVIVTEAAASSGSLITANFALEQGKQVMAVPGSIMSPYSAGPNNLIKTGAMPITDATDVLAALNFSSPEIVATPVKAKSKEEALILELLGQGVNTSQDLIEQSKLSASQFANIISLMEITGKVRNLGAGVWIAR
jgi:DNA processing protein